MKHFCDIYHLKNLSKGCDSLYKSIKAIMHRSISHKLLTQFRSNSGNRNRALRFCQNEYTRLEKFFQQTETLVRLFLKL